MNARAVDRFDGGSDDELKGRVERADRSRPRLTELALVPPERGRHGHLRPRVLSWRNGRIRLVQRCLAGLQVDHRDQRRRFPVRATAQSANHRFISTYFAASPDGTLLTLPLWQLLTATFFHARHHAPRWATCGSSGSSAARWSRSTAAATSSLFTCARPIFSTLVWVLIDAASESGPDSAHDRRVWGGHGRRDALHLVLPQARDPAFLHPDADVDAAGALSCAIPCSRILAGGHSQVAVESHLAGAGFAFLFKQFDLRGRGCSPGVCSGRGCASSRRFLASRPGRGRRTRRERRRAWGAPQVPFGLRAPRGAA